MNLSLARALAAVLAAGALPLAFAQANAPAQTNPAAQTNAPAVTYVSEPIASASSANAAQGPVGAIVQELNADTSLNGSKITVQPDENTVILTGVTRTYAQATRASKVAATHAGEGKVVNAILTEEIVILVAPPADQESPASLEVVQPPA